MDVFMGNFNLPHVCIVMDRLAFQVCLGINFIRQNAKMVLGLIFTPSRFIVKNAETDELSSVSLSEKSCQKEGGNRLQPAQSSLRISRREAYNWQDFQLCCTNPPWSHLQKMVTKAVLDRAQVVVFLS